MADRTEAKRSYEWSDRYLSDFLDTTTINGIFHVFRDRSNIRRIIWGIVFIASIIGCIVSCSLEVAEYAKHPSATTTTFSLSEWLKFPAVTICNLNIRDSISGPDNDQKYHLLNSLFNPNARFLLHYFGLKLTDLVGECERRVANLTKLEQDLQIVKSLSNISDFVHYCGFIAGPGHSAISCKDKFYPVLTPEGICFTLNDRESDELFATTGIQYGLKLILNSNPETYRSYMGIAGVRVDVHERGDFPKPHVHGIDISPGQNVEIGVQRMTKIYNNDQNCIHDYRLEFFPSYRYSHVSCRQNSFVHYVAGNDSCGCVLSEDRPISGPHVDTRNCTFSDICCLINQRITYYDELNFCPVSCDQHQFNFENSYSSFPNGQTLSELSKLLNVSTDAVRSSFLSVHIYFDEVHAITSVTDFTYSAVNLLSNIGGLMGLFLGISIISIFEVLILILDEAKQKIYTKRCRQKIRRFDEMITLPEITPTEDSQIKEDEAPPTNNEQDQIPVMERRSTL